MSTYVGDIEGEIAGCRSCGAGTRPAGRPPLAVGSDEAQVRIARVLDNIIELLASPSVRTQRMSGRT